MFLSGAIFVEASWSSGNVIIDEINGVIGGVQSTISIAIFIGASRSSDNGGIDEGNEGIDRGCSTLSVTIFFGESWSTGNGRFYVGFLSLSGATFFSVTILLKWKNLLMK